MALNDVLPSYIEPCVVDRSDSGWQSALDYGEFYYPPSDSQEYPNVTLVYNGKALNVPTEFVHASLSGISIKHYYGKCYQEIAEREEEEEEEDEHQYDEGLFYEYPNGELDAFDRLTQDGQRSLSKTSEESLSESGTFEYREDSVAKEGQPICTLPRINHRNSFWNIHRPELSKLTWGQKYVSAATVTDHLHEHLTPHGELCFGFHTEEERNFILNRELDEYVRLKVLACPRELPPDEPFFNFKEEKTNAKPIDPRCKARGYPERRYPVATQNRYFPLKDDEETVGKSIRRSKEEFCLTIGKYVSQPLFVKSVTKLEEAYITPELSSAAEEEACDLFFYNWFLYGEQSYEGDSLDTRSTALSETVSEDLAEPCPPLMLDDLCRAAGKADFSDLRCNPDF